jgi:hypothetical protein
MVKAPYESGANGGASPWASQAVLRRLATALKVDEDDLIGRKAGGWRGITVRVTRTKAVAPIRRAECARNRNQNGDFGNRDRGKLRLAWHRTDGIMPHRFPHFSSA